MTLRCPTCGQWLRELDAVELLEILANGQPHRSVYRSREDQWRVTHGGGEAAAEAVESLRRVGAIHSVYSNCPDDMFHVGRTLDFKRTMEYRGGRKRKDWKRFYVGDPDDRSAA